VSKTRLGDICTIIKGTKVEQTEQDCNSIRYIQIEDLRSNECIKYCEKKEHYVIANPRDIIIAWDGANAGTVGFGLSGAIGSTLAIIRLNREDFDTRFLGMLLRKKFNYLRSNCTGATIPHINRRSLEEVKIPLLPLETQKQIAKTLDTVSELLSLRKQQLAELDHLIRSIFYNMFGEPITNSKNWKVVRLQDVCDVRDGTHDSPQYVQNGYPLITSKNIVNGSISFDNVNYITKEDFDQINKRSKVDVGDIIMPMIGTIGNPAIVKTDVEFAIKNVALIKFTTNKIINTYLKMLLSSSFFDIKTKEKSRGGTQKFIALGDIRNLNIPLPPISLQVEFDGFVKQIEEQKELVRRAIKETQLLFDSLMSQYFDE